MGVVRVEKRDLFPAVTAEHPGGDEPRLGRIERDFDIGILRKIGLQPVALAGQFPDPPDGGQHAAAEIRHVPVRDEQGMPGGLQGRQEIPHLLRIFLRAAIQYAILGHIQAAGPAQGRKELAGELEALLDVGTLDIECEGGIAAF